MPIQHPFHYQLGVCRLPEGYKYLEGLSTFAIWWYM